MPGTIERAFEIANSGSCKNVDEIKRQLKQEGYSGVAEHLDGPSIKKQLLAAMKNGLRQWK